MFRRNEWGMLLLEPGVIMTLGDGIPYCSRTQACLNAEILSLLYASKVGLDQSNILEHRPYTAILSHPHIARWK